MESTSGTIEATLPADSALPSILPDQHARARTTPVRVGRVVILAALLVAMVAGIFATLRSDLNQFSSVDDFVEYWGAGRLNLTGGNPYSATELLALQKQVGWVDSTALMMWNPPPALTLVMPFGLLNYELGRLLWLVLAIITFFMCGAVLWRLYAGSATHNILAMVLTFTFMPTLVLLSMGQIGFFVLAGLVGFLAFTRQKRWAAAGAILALLLLKPHLTYLIWPALALWFLRERKWGMAIGGMVALAVAWLLPTLVNPQVTSQYWAAVSEAPPIYWRTSTLGSALRVLLDWDRVWLQFIPSVFGLVWLLWYWARRRAVWVWQDELPLVLLVSVGTMSFGWALDMVVLLPAIIQMATWVVADTRVQGGRAWYGRSLLALYLALNVFLLILAQLNAVGESYIWLPWTLLAAYLFLRARHARAAQSAAPAPLPEVIPAT